MPSRISALNEDRRYGFMDGLLQMCQVGAAGASSRRAASAQSQYVEHWREEQVEQRPPRASHHRDAHGRRICL